jgi:hypothetical protein
MNQFSMRFNLAMSDDELDRRITVQPEPLIGLGALDPVTAMVHIELALKRVFSPTVQIRVLLREFLAIAKSYSDLTYCDSQAFVDRCVKKDLSRGDSNLILILTGLAGAGKTELLRKLLCLIDNKVETTEIPGLPVYPVETLWSMTARSGITLASLLNPMLPFDQRCAPREVLTVAAKRAHTVGLSLGIIDEFQFHSGTSNAHASAAATVLGMSLVGPPVCVVANFSMLNKLAKRPHEERSRLLGRIRALHPDRNDSPCWAATTVGQCQIAPELFAPDKAFKPEKDGVALHSYSYGLKRDSAKLLRVGYWFAREAGRDYVQLADIEKAYRSDEFKSNRQDIERRKATLAMSVRKPSDVYCPLVPDGPSETSENDVVKKAPTTYTKEKQHEEPVTSKVTALVKSKAEFESRVTDQLVLSGLNPQDRAEYEKSLASMSPPDEGTEKVRQLRRPKPTKDSLTDAFNLQQ